MKNQEVGEYNVLPYRSLRRQSLQLHFDCSAEWSILCLSEFRMPTVEQELNTPIVYDTHFGCSQRVLKITYLTCNYFHQAVEQFVPSKRNPCGKEQAGTGWQQRLHPPLPWRQLSPGTSCRARSGMLRSAPATSAPCNLPCAQSAPGSGTGRRSCRTAMQPSPRRRSAVSIFSHFFQGRRHSSSDPLLRLSQRRRSSVVELLSSSTHRVMVALSSLSPEELDATFPEKKSKVLFIETAGSLGYFLGITILLFC